MAPSFTANTSVVLPFSQPITPNLLYIRYSYVWNETLRAFREIDAYEWEGKDEIMLPAVNDITNKVFLLPLFYWLAL